MSRFRTVFIPVALLVGAGCLCFSGCSDGRPRRVPVAGKVTIDGQPLKTGMIYFVPDKDRASASALDAEGHFVLTCYVEGDGAVLGKHEVTVEGKELLDPYHIRWYAPKKYAFMGTSGLTETITGPVDNLEIKLSWDGGKPFVEDTNAGAPASAPKKKPKNVHEE